MHKDKICAIRWDFVFTYHSKTLCYELSWMLWVRVNPVFKYNCLQEAIFSLMHQHCVKSVNTYHFGSDCSNLTGFFAIHTFLKRHLQSECMKSVCVYVFSSVWCINVFLRIINL